MQVGPILATSWADLVPKWGPQWAPKLSKNVPKRIKQIIPPITKIYNFRSHFWTEVYKQLLVPRCAQDGPRLPQVAQDSSKLAQKGSQDAPEMIKDCFK